MKKFVFGLVCFSLTMMASQSQGATVNTIGIQYPAIFTQWYNGAGGGSFQPTFLANPSISVTNQLIRDTNNDDYTFTGTVTVSASSLISDSTVTNATGTFAGGISLSLFGTVTRLSDNAILANNESVLTAVMTDATWTIEEKTNVPNTAQGFASWTPTGGYLLANPDLVIGDFDGTFTFIGSSPQLTNFGATSYTAQIGDLQIEAVIPEPATLTLLGLGGLGLIRRRRQ